MCFFTKTCKFADVRRENFKVNCWMDWFSLYFGHFLSCCRWAVNPNYDLLTKFLKRLTCYLFKYLFSITWLYVLFCFPIHYQHFKFLLVIIALPIFSQFKLQYAIALFLLVWYTMLSWTIDKLIWGRKLVEVISQCWIKLWRSYNLLSHPLTHYWTGVCSSLESAAIISAAVLTLISDT